MRRAVLLVVLLALPGPALAAQAHDPATPGSPDPAPPGIPVEDRWIATLHQARGTPSLPLLPEGVHLVRTYTILDAALLAIPPALVDQVRELPAIQRLDPDEPLEPHLDVSRSLLRVEEARTAEPVTASGIRVAVIDSGIDATHPGLTDRVVDRVTVTDQGTVPATIDERDHGTHVAGIVSGTGAASPGDRYRGLEPTAELIDVDLGGDWTVDKAIRAFEYLLENQDELEPRIVVSSFGRMRGADTFDAGDPLVQATDELAEAGMLVVFSAGNRGPEPGTMANEALNPRALAVGATDATGEPATFTSRGPPGSGKPDLWAPGVEILSPHALVSSRVPSVQDALGRNQAPGFHDALTGTSLAAPQAAGTAALLLARSPETTLPQLRAALEQGSVAAPGGTSARVLDAARALERLTDGAMPLATHLRYAEDRTVVQAAGLPVTGGLPGQATQLRFPVSTWATGGQVTATATGGTFEFTLLDPTGAQRGSRVTGSSATFPLPADPSPGPWTVEATAQDLVGASNLSLDVDLEEERPLPEDEPLGPAAGGRPAPQQDGGIPGWQILVAALLVLVLALAGGGLAYGFQRT